MDNDVSVSFKVCTLGLHTVLPVINSYPVIFSWISLIVWNLSCCFSKVILVLGKNRSHKTPNLSCSGAESPGWVNFWPKNSAWDLMHQWARVRGDTANHQLPIAAAFWIIWVVSMAECSSLMENLIQIRYSTCSGILNVTATQYTGSLNSVFSPHWLVQWSCHCSCMCIPVHSPWLPGYTKLHKPFLLY